MIPACCTIILVFCSFAQVGCRRAPSTETQRTAPPSSVRTSSDLRSIDPLPVDADAAQIEEALLKRNNSGKALVALLPRVPSLDDPAVDRTEWVRRHPDQVIAYLASDHPYSQWWTCSHQEWASATGRVVPVGKAAREARNVPFVSEADRDSLLRTHGGDPQALAGEAVSPSAAFVSFVVGLRFSMEPDGPIVGDAPTVHGPFRVITSTCPLECVVSDYRLAASDHLTIPPALWWSDDSEFVFISSQTPPAIAWLCPTKSILEPSPSRVDRGTLK